MYEEFMDKWAFPIFAGVFLFIGIIAFIYPIHIWNFTAKNLISPEDFKISEVKLVVRFMGVTFTLVGLTIIIWLGLRHIVGN